MMIIINDKNRKIENYESNKKKRISQIGLFFLIYIFRMARKNLDFDKHFK